MNSDERLRQALQEDMNAALNALPQEESHIFSARFERRMERLIHRVDHPVSYRLTRVAAVFLALFLTGLSWLSFDTAAREQLIIWLRETYETTFAYRFYGHAPTKTSSYRPAWLPEGYILADVWEDSENVTVIYENADGAALYFQYIPGKDGTALYIHEELPPETVKVHHYFADYYPSGKQGYNSSLVWIDDANGMLFSISADLALDDLLKIAESVQME